MRQIVERWTGWTCEHRAETALFTSMERWAKRLFVGFEKDGLLAELQARTSRICRFCCFLPHT